MSTKRKSQLLYSVKLLIGLGLLAALILIDDNWRKVIEIAGNIQLTYLIPFAIVSTLTIWISCVKWRLFLRERAMDLPVRRLMGLYVIGFFFNNFLPSTVGGDVARSYMLGRQIDSQGRALATVFLERFTGFIAMVSLTVGAFMLNPTLRGEPMVLWSVFVMASLTAGVLLAIFHPGMVSRMLSALPMPAIGEAISRKALKFHGHIAHFRGDWVLIMRAMAYSYGFYALAAVKVYVAGLLLGIPLNFAQLLVVTPIVMLIAAIPITPNSLGIQEWGYSVYLIFAGATMEQGLAIALVLRATKIVLSVLGGLLFLLEQDPVQQVATSDTSTVHESLDGQPDYEVRDPVT